MEVLSKANYSAESLAVPMDCIDCNRDDRSDGAFVNDFNFPEWYKMFRKNESEQGQMERCFHSVLLQNPELAVTKDERGDTPLHYGQSASRCEAGMFDHLRQQRYDAVTPCL
jgi:hypothetical protein